jgi:hypothetical protein
MSQPIAVPARNDRKSRGNFFLWWRIDPAEVERQVDGYDILGVAHSARKGSAALCALSVVITAAFGSYMKMPTGTIAIEVLVWGGLALAMARGTRWAFAAGLVLWTLEKAFGIVNGPSSAAPVVQSSGGRSTCTASCWPTRWSRRAWSALERASAKRLPPGRGACGRCCGVPPMQRPRQRSRCMGAWD